MLMSARPLLFGRLIFAVGVILDFAVLSDYLHEQAAAEARKECADQILTALSRHFSKSDASYAS
jgi:hypothetical protein